MRHLPKWQDLPTQLIRAVGRIISYPPWQEAFARKIRKAEVITDQTLYALVRHHADQVRKGCKQFPLELSPRVPTGFTVENLAKILVRIVILEEGGNKPERERIEPSHFASCPICRFQLLRHLDIFVMTASDEECPFYTHIAGPLRKEIAQLIRESPRGVFKGYLDQEVSRQIVEILERGEEPSEEEIGRMLKGCIKTAGLMTQAHLKKPEDVDPKSN